MSIYIFSLLVGYMPNGIDNAQANRDPYLQRMGVPVRYVYTDMPTNRYIQRYHKAGVPLENMLCAHMLFTDTTCVNPFNDIEHKVQQLQRDLQATAVVREDSYIKFSRNGMRVAQMSIDTANRYYYEISYYDRERLIVRESYVGNLCYTDHFVTASSTQGLYAKQVRRTFRNSDGTIAYEIITADKGEKIYIFPDGRTMNLEQFLAEFIRRLQLTEQDVVILDRSAKLEFVQPLFQYGSRAKFAAFFHSGHYYMPYEDTGSTYFNSEYYYWMRHMHHIRALLVSTQEQKDDLIEKLAPYCGSLPPVHVIPASGLDKLRFPDEPRRPYSIMTASRIDHRKRLEWIIDGAVKAHRVNPEITLDIYGRGDADYTEALKKQIADRNAGDYVHLMGRMDIREKYKGYELYAAASLWETLGLSVMEAAGSGNALVGLDVRYGNRVFIQNGVNGQRVDFELDRQTDTAYIEDMTDRFAQAILDIFRDRDRLKNYEQASYQIAREYLNDTIEEKWVAFLKDFMKS